MSTADGLKTLGDTITAIGTAFKATHNPNAELIGSLIEKGGDYISNATSATVEATGGRSVPEIGGRLLTAYILQNASH